MRYASLLLLAGMMMGCGKSESAPKSSTVNAAPISETPDNWTLIFFNLELTTLLNKDSTNISRCTLEVLKGKDAPPYANKPARLRILF